MPRPGQRMEFTIGERTLALSNLDKVFYPQAGFRKADVLQYYADVAPVLLPHLKGRPLTLKRYPDGVEGDFFYQKECPGHAPSWLSRACIHSQRKGEDTCYCMANDLASLLWLVNMADLEFHTLLSRAPDFDTPTMIAMDLDPGLPADILDCCEVALHLRDALKSQRLESFAKTSGSKGLQVYVPLNTRTDFDATKAYANALARAVEERFPKRVTSNMRKDLRVGKVFIDWSQNVDHKTTVSVYSLRARPRPTVSTPLAWSEVEEAVEEKERPVYEAGQVLDRVQQRGDLFAPVLARRQKLPV